MRNQIGPKTKMKAITTKYHAATDFRGSRISARAEGGNVTFISYPHELSGEDCYRAAADALCKKMGWDKLGHRLIGGGTGNGWVFVFAPKN